MPRSRPQLMPKQERNKLLREFWTTLALMESLEEIQNFFRDLLSETEAIMLARRLKIARLIYAGYSYDEIEKELHTSATTIASVHAWLDGGFGGYINGIAKLQKELERQQMLHDKKEKAKEPFSFERLKQKYPLHFLLFNAADEIKYRPPKRMKK